jgi:hypothetical protein
MPSLPSAGSPSWDCPVYERWGADVADGSWSQSGCRGDVWWYGFPGQGCYYWTARFGTYWVGSPLSTYAAWQWECGQLGAPVKEYQFLSEFQAAGQWFEGGAIYFKGGSWKVATGNFGQTAGRFADDAEWPEDVEMPPTSEPPPKPDPPSLDI